MGHRRFALAAAALLLLPAPAGAAGLRFRDAGMGSSISGDGTSVIAWATPQGTVRVVTPDGRMRDVVPPCDGRFQTAGGSAVLFACSGSGIGPDGEELFALQRLDGTPPFLFRGPRAGAGGERWEPQEMGRAWITGSYVGYHVNLRLYRRRDGSRTVFGDRDPFGATRTLDLDRRGLARPLCRGIRRVRADEEIDTTNRWGSVEYDPPWAVVFTGRGLALRRCSPHGARTVRTGLPYAVQLGAGIVTWGEVTRSGRSTLVVLRPGRPAKRYRLPGTFIPIARAGRVILLRPEYAPQTMPLLLTRIPAR